MIRLCNRTPGHPIDEDWFGRLTSPHVDQLNAGAFRREMPVAPGKDRDQHGAEVAPKRGQHVLIPRRMLVVAAPLQEA
jgi:hypothetical protein